MHDCVFNCLFHSLLSLVKQKASQHKLNEKMFIILMGALQSKFNKEKCTNMFYPYDVRRNIIIVQWHRRSDIQSINKDNDIDAKKRQ